MSTLSLRDLKPRESTFKLEAAPDRVFTLKKFSLAAQAWCGENFTKKELEDAGNLKNILVAAKVVCHLLKTPMPLEEFLELICTYDDQVAVTTALLETIGVSQPEVDQIRKEAQVEGNAVAPQTGANSSI